MRGPRKFCQRGSNFDNVLFIYNYYYFFLWGGGGVVNEGRKVPNTTLSGPTSTAGVATADPFANKLPFYLTLDFRIQLTRSRD